MYIPHFNAWDDRDEIVAMVRAVGAAQLVTVDAAGAPQATLLPVIWDDDRLVFHLARANEHWRQIVPGSPALAIVAGPQAYISPSWYAAKAEHGRVVPTWNYETVHLRGTVEVHQDQEWLRDAVSRLTDLHEQSRLQPWAVTDAPATYVDKQLRAIVGVELRIEQVEAKAKLSQNRSESDVRGVIDGLRLQPDPRDHQIAEAMTRADRSR